MTPVPGAGASDHQSARVSGNDQVPPPAKVTVATPEAVPEAAALRRPSRSPEPASTTDCPEARAVSWGGVGVGGWGRGGAAAGTATSQVVRTDRPPSTRSNVAGEVAVTVQSCAADSAITTRSFGSTAPLCNVVVTVTVVPVSTTRGASRTSSPPTANPADPSTPPTVTVTVATPLPVAVARPVPLTVRVAGSLLRDRTPTRERSTKD